MAEEIRATMAVIVPVTLNGTSVSFCVPAGVDARGDFHGVASREGLIGSFSGNGQKVILKWKDSYWQ